MTAQRATVGRVVHYVSQGSPLRPDGTQAYVSTCRAATVTEVNAEEPHQVGLAVLNPSGLFFRPLSEGGCFLLDPDGRPCSAAPGERVGGTWHWPERV